MGGAFVLCDQLSTTTQQGTNEPIPLGRQMPLFQRLNVGLAVHESGAGNSIMCAQPPDVLWYHLHDTMKRAMYMLTFQKTGQKATELILGSLLNSQCLKEQRWGEPKIGLD